MASGYLDNGSPGPTRPSRWTADSREKRRRKGDGAILFKDLSHLCGYAHVCFPSLPPCVLSASRLVTQACPAQGVGGGPRSTRAPSDRVFARCLVTGGHMPLSSVVPQTSTCETRESQQMCGVTDPVGSLTAAPSRASPHLFPVPQPPTLPFGV